MSATDLVLRPRISEKSYGLSSRRVYVFDVPKTSNKLDISSAVSAQYNVTVDKVNIAIIKGKPVRQYRKRKFDNGNRVDIKKAYVTLAEGSSIPLFQAEDDSADKKKKESSKKPSQAKPVNTKSVSKPVKSASRSRLFRRNKEGEK